MLSKQFHCCKGDKKQWLKKSIISLKSSIFVKQGGPTAHAVSRGLLHEKVIWRNDHHRQICASTDKK